VLELQAVQAIHGVQVALGLQAVQAIHGVQVVL